MTSSIRNYTLGAATPYTTAAAARFVPRQLTLLSDTALGTGRISDRQRRANRSFATTCSPAMTAERSPTALVFSAYHLHRQPFADHGPVHHPANTNSIITNLPACRKSLTLGRIVATDSVAGGLDGRILTFDGSGTTLRNWS